MVAPSSFKLQRARIRNRTAGLALRLLDIGVGLFVAALMLPIWSCHFFLARLQGSPWLTGKPVLGQGGKSIRLLKANRVKAGVFSPLFNHRFIRKSPVFFSILRGEMSLVGPAPVSVAQRDTVPAKYLRRLDAKPGLIHTYFLRASSNIAFQDEKELALADAERSGFWSRLAMMARAVPALLFGSRRETGHENEMTMFGLRFALLPLQTAVEDVTGMALGKGKHRVAFVNPACVNIALKNRDYRRVLEVSDHLYPDGIGMQVASKMLGLRMRDNLNGTDLLPALWQHVQDLDIGFFLLGARPGVCEKMAANLRQQYPRLSIRGFRHGYFQEDDIPRIVDEINGSDAQILLVAMGVPAQELWLDRVWADLDVRVAMGVGGLFDFVSGRIPRAPVWMREMGLEWSYRLMREPLRLWRRYLIGNVVFLWNVLRYGK